MYIFGILIAFGSILTAMTQLKQSAHNYQDLVAVCIVIGGTLSVSVITFPWHYWIEILHAIKALFLSPLGNVKVLMEECQGLVQTILNGSLAVKVRVKGLAGEILLDGAELIGLGFNSETIFEILDDRIHHSCQRTERVANALRSLSKYPPAFGLIGTVLGLVSLMGAVSTGSDSREVGSRMATTLVATLYGLLLSNLVINPAGELLLKYVQEQKRRAEIAMRAVLLAADRSSLLLAQESLNTFVARPYRINALTTLLAYNESARGPNRDEEIAA